MSSLPELIASADGAGSSLRVAITDNWMQGRTAYGGVTAALALQAVLDDHADLPPLRSAQIAFVGPLAGTVAVEVTPLRRGKLASFIQADVSSEAGLGLRATFLFMDSIPSSVDYNDSAAPDAPEPEAAEPAMLRRSNFFTSNFEYRHALPISERRTPDFLRWVRLEERAGLHPMVELLSVADALPPAAMPLFKAPGPVSSLTWLVNLLTPQPATRDGWWLLRATSDYARSGSSSQVMRIWNAQGDPISSGMQSVALFA
jgi:acyl-CoA thioesterase